MQLPAENLVSEKYLELLKKTLIFSLWPDPPSPAILYNKSRPHWKAAGVTVATKVLSRFGIVPCNELRFSEEQIMEGKVWRNYATTMIGMRRLDNLQGCMHTVLKDAVPGDFIETGAWQGGACIFMCGILAAYGIADRKVFVADSFEGLPKPDGDKYPADIGDKHHLETIFCTDMEHVKNNFRKFGLLDDKVIFLKGWFKDTLPAAPIQKLAILRLDGDMYGSTMEALQTLYPKLSAGGFCIADDYALKGCRAAIDDYRRQHEIMQEMIQIDWTGVFWRK